MLAERHSDFSHEVLRHWPGSACDWLAVIANSAAANVTKHWIIIVSVQHWNATLKKTSSLVFPVQPRYYSNQTLFIHETLIQNALKNNIFWTVKNVFGFFMLKGIQLCFAHTTPETIFLLLILVFPDSLWQQDFLKVSMCGSQNLPLPSLYDGSLFLCLNDLLIWEMGPFRARRRHSNRW